MLWCVRMYAEQGMVPVLFERRLETRGAKHTHVQVSTIPARVGLDHFPSRRKASGRGLNRPQTGHASSESRHPCGRVWCGMSWAGHPAA